MRVVDLSAPIATSPPGSPDHQRTVVEYIDHRAGAREIEQLFGVGPELLRDGEGWSRELLTLGTHNSTHVDAPYHYNSHVDGRAAATIDELPLERFIGPGVVLDVRDHADGEAVTVSAVQSALRRIEHELAPGDIVCMWTGRDAFYGRPDYMDRGPGVTADATRWLYERGVRVMGIDAWGWDRPLRLQAAEAISGHRAGVFWEAHQVGLPYSQIERLVNLGEVPATGATIACFPLRIQRASAAPARVVALLDD